MNETGPEISTGESALPKKPKLPRPLIIAAGIIILLIAAAAAIFHSYYSALSTDNDSERADFEALADISAEEQAALDELGLEGLDSSLWAFNSEDVTNILLIGVDNNDPTALNSRGNADGLVIASINRKTHKLILTSLMRDIYVYVPNNYSTKLTLTYHFGGTDMLIEAIEYNFGIHIDNYILVNYLNVIDLVDAMGGVDLELTNAEVFFMNRKISNLDWVNGSETSNKLDPGTEGMTHLNGVQTAAFMRVRNAGNNDYERTSRARRVLIELKNKASAMKFTELSAIADDLLPYIHTDLSELQVLSLMANAPAIIRYDTESIRLPIDGSSYGATITGSVIVVDFETNGRYFNEVVYGIESK